MVAERIFNNVVVVKITLVCWFKTRLCVHYTKTEKVPWLRHIQALLNSAKTVTTECQVLSKIKKVYTDFIFCNDIHYQSKFCQNGSLSFYIN